MPVGNAFLCVFVLLVSSGVSPAQQTPLSQRHTPGGEPLRRPDDRRPPDQWTVWLFNRPLTIGGEVESELGYEGNFSLLDGAKDGILRLGQELVLEFSYPLTKNILLFAEGIAFHERDLYAKGHKQRFNGGVELGQAWIYLSKLLGSNFNVRIGRQAVWEDRNWWWDDDLDAIRLYYSQGRFKAELAVAREVGQVSTKKDVEDRDVVRLLGRTEWEWARDHLLHNFFLYQNDRSNRHFIGQRVRA